MIIVLTCAEPDALAFLSRMPKGELEQATLVATRSVGAVLEAKNLAKSIWVITGVSSLRGLRRLAAGANGNMMIVIGPDYGTLFYRKGFVRARLLAPWLLPYGKRADLIRIRSGDEAGRKWLRCRRVHLLLRIYAHEALDLSWFFLLGIVSIPIALITLARLLPPLLVTETRARKLARRTRKERPPPSAV